MALALCLAACSGDGDESSQTQPASTLEPAVSTTSPRFSGEGSERFCSQARTANETLKQPVGPGDTAPDAVRARFTLAADTMRDLTEVAPAEIEGDVRVLAEAYDEMLDGLEDAGWDPTRLSAEASAKLEAPELRTSSERLLAYEEQVCTRP